MPAYVCANAMYLLCTFSTYQRAIYYLHTWKKSYICSKGFLKVGLPSQLVILAIWHSFSFNVLAIFDDNYCSTAAKHSTQGHKAGQQTSLSQTNSTFGVLNSLIGQNFIDLVSSFQKYVSQNLGAVSFCWNVSSSRFSQETEGGVVWWCLVGPFSLLV